MGALQKLRNLKDLIKDAASIIKICLTTFWFWVPVLFALYMILQLWIMFFIHPLALLIVPTILVIYLIIQEDRRFRAMYGLDKAKKKRASDPLFTTPGEFYGYQWDLEKALENYEKTIKETRKQAPERKGEDGKEK
ncbi:MAG: hypothetical protein QXT26_08675 [Thermoproteota archaeon]